MGQCNGIPVYKQGYVNISLNFVLLGAYDASLLSAAVYNLSDMADPAYSSFVYLEVDGMTDVLECAGQCLFTLDTCHFYVYELSNQTCLLGRFSVSNGSEWNVGSNFSFAVKSEYSTRCPVKSSHKVSHR